MRNKAPYIDELVTRLANTVKPEAILLFGSVARGTDDLDSDIDVLVIWDGAHDVPNRQRRIVLRDLIGDFDHPLDILTYSSQEFRDALQDPRSFASQVTKEAKVVHGLEIILKI